MSSNVIEIKGLTKEFPKFKLGPLDLNVPRGAIYGFIGANGAGKTTTLDLIFGMGRNDAGEIRLLGFDHRKDAVELKRHAAYAGPDMNYQTWGKVGKAIRFVRGFFPDWDDEYCEQLMTTFNLDADGKIASLSFGAKTKLGLLIALSRRPDVLILDEPTTGLDPESKQQLFAELLKAVESGERTVLISSHGLSDLERFADHVGVIKDGKMLLEGRMDEVVDRFRFVDFFTETIASFGIIRGLTILKRTDNRYQGLLDLHATAAEALTSRGARQLTLTPMTLEDIFLALMKDGVPL